MIQEEFCFIIAPYKPELTDIYVSTIKPAVESQGLKCIRADENKDTGNMIKRLVEYITKAKVIIADLTGKSANVLYELGIANALGNNTIVIAQSMDDVPFDIQSYHVIIYKNSMKGASDLHNHITEKIKTFNEWSAQPNNPVQDFLPQTSVSIGQYKTTVDELEETKGKLQSAEKHLLEYEDIKQKYMAMKDDYDIIHKKSIQFETLQQWLGPWFVGGDKAKRGGITDFMGSVKEVMDRVKNEGQVSLNGSAEQTDKKRERITFKLIK